MNKTIILVTCFTLFLAGCSSMGEKKVEKEAVKEEVVINDYPTRDRVEYVLECIAKHGGLSFINQYACGCKIDKIAEKLSFKEYESAKTFSLLKKTPGENGAAFRDPKHAKNLRTQLKEADKYAESQCFVN
jgi:ABC-type Fe3+-hydroxamate transport system substrate-binding protein